MAKIVTVTLTVRLVPDHIGTMLADRIDNHYALMDVLTDELIEQVSSEYDNVTVDNLEVTDA